MTDFLKHNLILLTFLLCLGLGTSQPASAQENYLKGTVCDSTTLTPMPGCVVELIDRDSTSLRYVMTNENGAFLFNNMKAGRPKLRITMLGFHTRILDIPTGETDMGMITLNEDVQVLEAAVTEVQAIRSSQNGDTLTYNAAAYKTVMGASSEDLIGKMPGIALSERTVEANGKKVTRILVDGKEYFGDDVMTALRNVPADLIAEVNVMNKLSDEAELTHMDDGENNATINIVTKKRKMGLKGGSLVGRFYGGWGILDKYIGGGNVNWFGEKNSATILGMANNISRYNFVSNDLVSASTPDQNTAGSDFSVRPLAGVSSVQSVGANYTNKWFSGSYLFNRIDNENDMRHDTDRWVEDQEGNELTQENDQFSKFATINNVHRLNAKMSFSKNRHRLIFRPNFNFQDINSRSTQASHVQNTSPMGSELPDVFLYNRFNRNASKRGVLSTGGRLAYSYAFDKRGRYLQIGVNGAYSQNLGDEDANSYIFRQRELLEGIGLDTLDRVMTPEILEQATSKNLYLRDRNIHNWNAGGNVTYTEPLGKYSRLAIDYKVNYASNVADNTVWRLDPETGEPGALPDPRQSAQNQSSFLTNTAGFRYNLHIKKYTLTTNIAWQHVDMTSSAVLPQETASEKHFNNPVYNLVANLPFNKENSLRIDAGGWTRNPGVQQLQDVVNMNNRSFVSAGNPDLQPSYLHKLHARYLHTNLKKGSTITLVANYEGSANFIGSSIVFDNPDFIIYDDVKLGEGNQFSKPENLPGYFKVNTRFTYGFPVKFLRSNVNVNANAMWSAVPNRINGTVVPVCRNHYGGSLRLDSNISELLDFTISYDCNYINNEYTNGRRKVANNFIMQNARGKIKWIFWKGMTLTASAHWQNYLSMDKRYNDNRVYCDLFLGKRLFKNQLGEISVGCNDIFNHTARYFGHNITVAGTYDTSHIGVGRYFSIQFVYHLRKM